MQVVDRPASYARLTINGLSYSDWEDEADQLRQLATSTAPVRKYHLTHAQKLLSSLEAELEAIDSVSPGLSGFDAIRVGCVRDLVVAMQDSLKETLRQLRDRSPKRASRARAKTKAH